MNRTIFRSCLRSVAFSRQIVVVDSESEDGTVRIASDFGCDVFVEPWRGFGPQKQFAVEKCREDWILVLDADERIPPETACVIRKLSTLRPPRPATVFREKLLSRDVGYAMQVGGRTG
ncbi:MAG: glycosyltransferase [Desulfobacterales bacterium]|nr:glycosyltransferase [Desulfobacterales bacterium]